MYRKKRKRKSDEFVGRYSNATIVSNKVSGDNNYFSLNLLNMHRTNFQWMTDGETYRAKKMSFKNKPEM